MRPTSHRLARYIIASYNLSRKDLVMAEIIETNAKTFSASAPIKQHARVILEAGGTIKEAGLAEKEIGTALTEAFAAGDRIAVKLRSAAGTHKMIASEQLGDPAVVGLAVYTQLVGEVQTSDEATAFLIGTLLSVGGAKGDIVEVLYNAHGDTANT